MKDMKNEQGYALLVVVLITVLIMGFFTFFVTASLNNANQEQVVDENHLKVAAAEMGVEYYTAALTNEYNDLLAKLLEEIQEDDSREINLCNEFEQVMIYSEEEYSGVTRYIPDFDSYYYNIQGHPKICDEVIVEREETEVKEYISVSGVVEGGNPNSESVERLDFVVTFSVPKFISDYEQEENDREQHNPGSITIPDRECNDSDSENEILDGNCWVNRYATKDLLPREVGNSSYQMNGKRLLVIGDLAMPRPGIPGGGHVPNITNSYIYVKGDFTVGNGFVPKMNTQIFVEGDIYGGPGIMPKPDESSRICVTEKIKRNRNNKEINNQQLNDRVYTLIDYKENGVTQVNNVEKLRAECGVTGSSTSPPDDFEWIEPIETDVQYN